MGGRGSNAMRNSGVSIEGVTGSIAQQYAQSEFTKHVNNVLVKTIKPSEFILTSWDGTPNDLHMSSIRVLNSYVEKNSLNPVRVEVARLSVAMELTNGDRVYTILAEPSGFATKKMSSYMRLYKEVNGKRKQIKQSEW